MAAKNHLRIVVVGPSGTQQEVARVKTVLDELNEGVADDRGVFLEWKHWTKDAYPGLHWFGPQGLIDEILQIEKADILLAIFNNLFGSPTTS